MSHSAIPPFYVSVHLTCPRCGHRNRPANNVELAILAIQKKKIPCKGHLDGKPCNALLTADPADFPKSTLKRAYKKLGLPVPPSTENPRSRASFIADNHGTVWLRR
jgi:hypothetical protein